MAPLRTLLCSLSFAVSLVLAACGSSSAAPALFKVSDADSHIWIFGSIHFLDGRAWRPPEFNAALAASDFVYFEMPITAESSARITELATTAGFLPFGTKLPDLLTEEQRIAFDEAVTEAGLDPRTFDSMRPWMAEVSLAQTAVSQGLGGVAPDHIQQGVEMTITAEVADERERYFETADMQFEVISGGSDAEHIDALMTALTADPADAAVFDPRAMIETWLAGDLEGIHSILAASMPVDGPAYRRMLTDRNLRWVAQMSEMLASNESAIAIVGAGHLAGPHGLPALLTEQGLTVDRIATTLPPPVRSRSQVR